MKELAIQCQKSLKSEKFEMLNNSNNLSSALLISSAEGQKKEGGLRGKGYFKSSYPSKPLISIITVVYNGEKYLEETIQSVINQSYNNIEYIIIDGGSTDGTLDIIKKYEDYIDYWISEKDYGLYHAMNKGIEASRGEIIGMINSDDYYFKDAFANVVGSYQNNSLDECIFCGDIMHGDILVKGWRQNNIKIGAFAPHPSMFVPKKIYDKIGVYKLQYKIASDYDFMYRAFNVFKLTPIYLPQKIAFFRPGGLASQHIFRSYTEEMLVKLDNGEELYKALGIYLLKLTKYFITHLMHKK